MLHMNITILIIITLFSVQQFMQQIQQQQQQQQLQINMLCEALKRKECDSVHLQASNGGVLQDNSEGEV